MNSKKNILIQEKKIVIAENLIEQILYEKPQIMKDVLSKKSFY